MKSCYLRSICMEQPDSQKTVVIGGISGGIGSSLARSLSDKGIRITGFAKTAEKLEALSSIIPGVQTSVVDATQPEAMDQFFAETTERFGRIDAYVHAVGSILIKPAHLTAPQDWEKTLQINLSSAFFALRSCVKQMQKQGGGSCLFFSTTAAQTGIANHEAIAAAKGGIEAMVRSAAATYAPRGVRVNAIAPSLTDTPLAQPILSSEKAIDISKRMHPLCDIAKAPDVASLAEWLIGDAAGFVTGQTFVIDGGLSTIVPKPRVQ